MTEPEALTWALKQLHDSIKAGIRATQGIDSYQYGLSVLTGRSTSRPVLDKITDHVLAEAERQGRQDIVSLFAECA